MNSFPLSTNSCVNVLPLFGISAAGAAPGPPAGFPPALAGALGPKFLTES
jgi:hypothetical protein